MGDDRQELDASIDLAFQLAKQHAGEMLPDVEYGERVAKAAPALLEACKAAWDATNVANPRRDCTAAEFEAMRMIREAIDQAEGTS